MHRHCKSLTQRAKSGGGTRSADLRIQPCETSFCGVGRVAGSLSRLRCAWRRDGRKRGREEGCETSAPRAELRRGEQSTHQTWMKFRNAFVYLIPTCGSSSTLGTPMLMR